MLPRLVPNHVKSYKKNFTYLAPNLLAGDGNEKKKKKKNLHYSPKCSFQLTSSVAPRIKTGYLYTNHHLSSFPVCTVYDLLHLTYCSFISITTRRLILTLILLPPGGSREATDSPRRGSVAKCM